MKSRDLPDEFEVRYCWRKDLPDEFEVINWGMKGVPDMAKDKDKFKSGATRNKIAPVRYDLVKWEFIREMAKVMHEGCESHGADNWTNGMPRSTVINHMFEHWHQYLEGDRKEPHLAKMAFGLMALWYYEVNDIEVEE